MDELTFETVTMTHVILGLTFIRAAASVSIGCCFTAALEWLKDWGNQFNKAASKPSFIEHLVALSKIEPAIQEHLEGFTPRMTSSPIKSYVDLKFPGPRTVQQLP